MEYVPVAVVTGVTKFTPFRTALTVTSVPFKLAPFSSNRSPEMSAPLALGNRQSTRDATARYFLDTFDAPFYSLMTLNRY